MKAYIAILVMVSLLLLAGCGTQKTDSFVITSNVYVPNNELTKQKSLDISSTDNEMDIYEVTLDDTVDLHLKTASTCTFVIKNLGVTAFLEQNEDYVLQFTASKTGIYEMACTNGYNGALHTVALLLVE